ncbi:hypothetical protein Z517_00199 [Fonsecaea pedrosoi CBS 271.37]|uniref:Uncharacterized protein n=1 Tax=Fonsecaea pedrosoi CBS 271.37 TaxID=1442368 RepID=A0A0D2E3Z4_9EURO|nr:uncharacterized protein Z517_00199 [Fonsecaea pedrosoi CBS 271.37]KIW84811.1 hypothetical protein Z517_00199 [Fonsecaea pedrosoi CBS 271.37]
MDSNKASQPAEKTAFVLGKFPLDKGKAKGVQDDKVIEARTKLARAMAERLVNGGNLRQIGFQNNMTGDQAGRLIAELALQASKKTEDSPEA